MFHISRCNRAEKILLDIAEVTNTLFAAIAPTLDGFVAIEPFAEIVNNCLFRKKRTPEVPQKAKSVIA